MGKSKISIDELTELHAGVEKILAGSIGASAAYHTIHKGIIYTPAEEKELSNVYAEILANLKLTPSELKKRVDYYQEREKLLTQQSEELEEKIKERDREIVERMDAERALVKSEEKYRTLIENLNIGVYRNTGGSPDDLSRPTLPCLKYSATIVPKILWTSQSRIFTRIRRKEGFLLKKC